MKNYFKIIFYMYLVFGVIFSISFGYSLINGDLNILDGAFSIVAFVAAYWTKKKRI